MLYEVITNPDRFRVRMRMASIGIRGCETGFRSTDVRNDVYILEIGKEETVVVAATVDGGDFDSVYVHDLSRKKEEDPKIKIIEMDQSGAGVSIIAKKGPTLVELDRVITSYSIHYTKLYENQDHRDGPVGCRCVHHCQERSNTG